MIRQTVHITGKGVGYAARLSNDRRILVGSQSGALLFRLCSLPRPVRKREQAEIKGTRPLLHAGGPGAVQ